MRALMVIAGLLLLTVALPARQQAPPAFEVASIKAVAPFAPGPGAPRPSLRIAGNRFEVHNYSLLALLNWTFNPAQGTFVYPDWLRASTERVDIQAVLPAGSTKAEVQAMLRTLLADRMGLKTHVEPRVIPSMDLTVAPGGLTMKAVDELDELEAKFELPQYTVDNLSNDGERRTITSLNTGLRTITARSNFVAVTFPDPGHPAKYVFDAARITMADFVRELSGRMDKPVVDMTGLTGVYRFTIDMPIPESLQRVLARVESDLGRDIGDRTPAIKVDMAKQVDTLGLRLTDRKAPLDVIVIDAINKAPTEN